MASVTMRGDYPRTRLIGQPRSGALWLTLEGEAVRNALDSTVYRQLLDHLDQAEDDPEVQAVVLTGAGTAFCSGMNLKTARHEDTDDGVQLATTAMDRLRTFGKPTIAAVNGSAVGAGVGLVLCCDVAIASSTARFSVPEIRIGILPISVAPLLVDAVGPREAKRRLLVGTDFDAHEAHRIGILHEVVAHGEIHRVVGRYLRDMEAARPIEIAATKKLVDACGGSGIDADEISRIIQQVADTPPSSAKHTAESAPRRKVLLTMTVDSVLSQSDAILAEIRPSVRGFVADRIRAEWITRMNEDGEFDASLVDAFASQGLLGMRIDSEYGGPGLGLYEYCVAQEEVSRRHPVLSILLSSTSGLTPMAIQEHGTKDQKDKYLPPMTTGQSRTSFALTEPEAGADAASIATRAERTEDGWKLNGVKHFISGAESSDLFLVLASTTPGKRGRGITAFLVESGAPGFTVASIDHTFGSPAWTLGELVFTDCLVGEDAVLGEVDAGFEIARQALDEGRLSVASICVGAADGMLSAACDYAQTRHTFGDYLANRQSIQWMIADSATEIAAARALIQSALSGLLEADDIGAQASMAKLFASEMAGRVADRVVQIHGAMGVVADSEVGRTFRDLRVFRIGEGPSEVQRMIIARDRLRREQSPQSTDRGRRV